MTKAMISGRCPAHPRGGETERADHDFHADQLQRDVGHGGDDAGHGDREPEMAAAETIADEIGGGHVALAVRDRPQPRKDEIEDGIDEDGVRHREETHGALAEHQRRHRDEGVGGVEIAAEQEPGDHGAEAAPAEPPFMQDIEIGLAPARGDEADPGDEQEERDEEELAVRSRSQDVSGTSVGSRPVPELLVRWVMRVSIT